MSKRLTELSLEQEKLELAIETMLSNDVRGESVDFGGDYQLLQSLGGRMSTYSLCFNGAYPAPAIFNEFIKK